MGMEKLEELRSRYTFDSREFGKVLLVASVTLLVVSVHATLQFQQASEKTDALNDNLTETSGIINSQGFNESLEALESVRGTDIAPQFITAADAFRQASSSFSLAEEANKGLENSSQLYRWLVLLSIMGMVTGMSFIYIFE